MDFPAVCSEYSPIWRYPSQPGLSSNRVQFPCVPRQLRFSDPDILLSENICCGQILKIHYTGIYIKNPRSTCTSTSVYILSLSETLHLSQI